MTVHMVALTRLPKCTIDAHPVSAVTRTTEMVSSVDLLKGQREVLIRHGDNIYHLRHTRNDKLILTK
jgi:hemin uptake protein HemP